MKVGIVGAGAGGTSILRALLRMDTIKITGIVDVDLDACLSQGKEYILY